MGHGHEDGSAEVGARIAAEAESLRGLLAKKSTESVAGWCANYHLSRVADLDNPGRLHSAHRQLSFLLGLMLSTPEPASRQELEEEEWDDVLGVLNAVFNGYSELFLPSRQELEAGLAPEWVRVRDVAMPTFLHYFFNGLMASVEQLRARITRYVSPFDTELREAWGMSATEALEVSEWITAALQNTLDDAQKAASAEKRARLALLDSPRSLEDLREQAASSGYRQILESFLEAVGRTKKVSRADLVGAFGRIGEVFWERFSVGRGEGAALTYPTELSVAELRPLVRLDAEEAICSSANSLYIAVLTAGEETLKASPARERFLSARDGMLEREVAQQIRRILGPTSSVFESVFERSDDQLEHDVVVICDDLALIVEAKASPPIEPFRDPERAFVRLQRAFRADTGIQKGFDQASRIRRRLDAGETIQLYWRGGDPAVTLDPARLRKWFCVCVTRDDYGPLATDLALLLEKQPEEPFPWVVNILDLEGIGDAWKYLRWGGAELFLYLEQRVRLHGKAFSADELDFMGAYIRHGSLQSFVDADADMIVVDPRYANFFDELYGHLYLEGGPPRVSVGEPVLSDLRASLAAGVPVPANRAKRRVSVPDPSNPWCACGSGFRFKMCCGQTGG